MPFIRDFTISTTGGTAATSIACGTPITQQNDLLVAMISSDGSIANTANATITAAGWYFQGGYTPGSATNDSGMQIYARYASASEPIDYTFSGLSSETLNASIIAIGDVFQTGTADPTNAFENKTASTTTPNWTTARQTFPALTTTNNDSLTLHFGVSDGTGLTGVPSCVEGPLMHLLIGKDGGSHCDGFGWTFKRTAGTIPTNTNYITAGGTAALTSFMAQMVVKPPAGGITVRAPYIIQDNCKLLMFGLGGAEVTSYGNTTATAANSTDFPTASLQLNGRPVVAGGATYNYTDQGVNTFHYAIGMLSVTTSGSWGSNQTTVPAMTDLAGSNLLFHVSPQAPASLQSIDSAKQSGACGFAIGLASTAGNCKVWHAHGANTPWDNSRWVPCIINTDATAGMIATAGAGTFNANSITKIGFFLSAKGVANAMTICSIWKMADTIAGGGDANRPFGIQDTVDIFAKAKERRSVILQGAKQLYVSQELQYGNGGTDPTYVNLDGAVFEFPRQYNKAAGLVNYNSVDNKVGVLFYPGAGETVSLKDAIFTSASKYKWGFHASSGAATVNTAGMQVIGAGTITTAANVPLSNCTFSSCDQITTAGNTYTSVLFKASNTATGAVSITGSTQALLQAALDKFVTCTWTNNTVAIRIIYTGTGNVSLDMSQCYFSGNTKDIRWEAGSGQTLTINYSGSSNPTTYETNNSTVVNFVSTVAVTIAAQVSLAGAEIRIYDLDNNPAGSYGTELSGTESHGSATYLYAGNNGNTIEIQIMLAGYEEYVQSYVMPATNQTLTVNLVAETNT